MFDEFGPEYVVNLYDPLTGVKGFLVIDNTALGMGKGGIRMTPNVSIEEVSRLARTMTWKNALAGIPFGGAKAGMIFDKSQTPEKEKMVRALARALSVFIPHKYIAGPDVNSGEQEMVWMAQELKNWQATTGKPQAFKDPITGAGGLPHELGSTGFGVAQATKVTAEIMGLKLKGMTVAIEGFGNVGTFTHKFLQDMGATIVAVADSSSAAYKSDGLDFAQMSKTKLEAKKTVGEYPGAKSVSHAEFWALPVDILVTAALTDAINASNKSSIAAKMIVEGSNIPMTEDIENEFYNRGVVVVPDFVANAGGVISSYAEHVGKTPEQMFVLVEEKIAASAKAVMTESINTKKNARQVALQLAQAKVRQAMKK